MGGFVGGTPLEDMDSTPSRDFYIVNNHTAKRTVEAEVAVGLGVGLAFFFVLLAPELVFELIRRMARVMVRAPLDFYW